MHREEKYRSRGGPWDTISVLSNNIHEVPMDHIANWYFTNWVNPDAQLGGAQTHTLHCLQLLLGDVWEGEVFVDSTSQHGCGSLIAVHHPP